MKHVYPMEILDAAGGIKGILGAGPFGETAVLLNRDSGVRTLNGILISFLEDRLVEHGAANPSQVGD